MGWNGAIAPRSSAGRTVIHVPTVVELAEIGLANVVAVDLKGRPTHYRLTPEGQERIYAAMREAAAERRNDPVTHYARPVPRGKMVKTRQQRSVI